MISGQDTCFLACGVKTVVIKTGKDGCFIKRDDMTMKVPAVAGITAIDTIGAGDNFNAGIIYGLLKYDVRYCDLGQISEDTWDKIIRCGIEFAADVCRSFNNSISPEFAKQLPPVN